MATTPFTLDIPTVLCILFSLSFMPIAYILSNQLVPRSSKRNRLLFLWHAYDALTHIFIEGSFLYECFFSWTSVAGMHARGPYFLNRPDRIYGPAYGTGPSARLWQEYAKADRRWAGTDTTVVSLELLTVLLGGPAAVYICYLIVKAGNGKAGSTRGNARAMQWFISTILATAELYGGFMTFAPEWLTGSSQLATDDMVYLWLYLFFFNTLWVFVPAWVLWEAKKEFKAAFVAKESVSPERSERSDTDRRKRH
ncbi:hypothetical protein N7478_010333 [Penicillium angulare]|uniref:uncharacterized protein n=1 Tax=Penicillium angulare TaxID=116970 RepID=UPI00253FF098|nr:uncharacterized protein N7478_010333 [Penicillium angulare]KAJ5267525.1 hypothetical protein N7478_010333 [Penicillium angulare]